MRRPPGTLAESETLLLSHSISQSRLLLVAIFLCSISAITLFEGGGAFGRTRQPPTWRQPDSLNSAAFTPAPDYSKFSHSSPRHKELMGSTNCGSCHHRKDGSPAPAFPVHQDCTGCHLVQFTAANSTSPINPICTICHQAEALNSTGAPFKKFPRLINFAAQFDHAQHLKGIDTARPANGCATCHTAATRGVAETIPAGLKAHQICYDCHSPGKAASKFSACSACHRPGSYSPTPTAARSYRTGFSHADHGPRQRLNCDRCHSVRGPQLPQTKQVTSIAPVEHVSSSRAQTCKTCHVGPRPVGDKGPNFDDCKHCHKGVKFRT